MTNKYKVTIKKTFNVEKDFMIHASSEEEALNIVDDMIKMGKINMLNYINPADSDQMIAVEEQKPTGRELVQYVNELYMQDPAHQITIEDVCMALGMPVPSMTVIDIPECPVDVAETE